MSLNYMGIGYCKHFRQEDRCIWCENDRLRTEIDRLKAENDDLRTVEWRCKFKAEQAKNADMQAEIARQRVELDSKRSALRRLRFELADATKAGTPYWSERDAMNGLIIDNQAKTDEIDRLRAILQPFAALAASLPDNWPGQCRLRVDRRGDGSEYVAYHGESESHLGILPMLDEWQATMEVSNE